ncbi:Ribokinase-like protein [Dunaliella salina]|uniref:ATP-dependent (S)-NAD(P)H-hydrate dehydratase n=1 Tax=Dunaliella salina TaxID=3046 RepID=A0ABQ7GUH5_DUNSA|nr:Ribokinase-like protein [Dunaliella salina]|eukprot:KAF5838277.1 Ribokinase-like protein [Dunaliella salina]
MLQAGTRQGLLTSVFRLPVPSHITSRLQAKGTTPPYSIKPAPPSSSRPLLTTMATADPAQQPESAHNVCIEQFSRWIPALSASSYKGQQGKIGVVGGCVEYTGAPFFAAHSAHKVGADLTYCISMPEAAPVLKGFSPDMMVMPYLPDTNDEQAASFRRYEPKLQGIIGRMSALIVGPGLGDDPGTVKVAIKIIKMACERDLPLLIDGSGLNIVAKDPSIIKGYKNCILTPNVAELGRLAKAVGVQLEGPVSTAWQEAAPQVAAAFEGPVLVSKGPADIITDGCTTLSCEVASGLKRSGGQGDIMAGVVATFVSWSRAAQKGPGGGLLPSVEALPITSNLDTASLLVSAYAGCAVLRTASNKAFRLKGRSLMAPDIIEHLAEALEHQFPNA